MKEPDIIINGRVCSCGEAATIRVAIEMLAQDLTDNGLRDDGLKKAYLDRIDDIRSMLNQQSTQTSTQPE